MRDLIVAVAVALAACSPPASRPDAAPNSAPDAGAAPDAAPPTDPAPFRLMRVNGARPLPVTPGAIVNNSMIVQPTVTRGVFLDGNRLALIADQAQTDVYTFDGNALVLAQPGVPWIAAAADLDGDGKDDTIGINGVRFADGYVAYEVAAGYPAAAVDLDGDGKLDVISAPGGCSSTAAACMWRQITGRHFVEAPDLLPRPTVPLYLQSIWHGQFGGVETLALAGWGAMDAPGLPNFYQRRAPTEPWSPVAAPRDYARGRIMFFAPLDDGCALALLDPAHVTVCPGFVERSEPYEMQLAASGLPMIPWAFALVDLDGDGVRDLLFAHGGDDFGNADTRAIGPMHPTAWHHTASGWREWTGTGLDAPTQSHTVTVGMIAGVPLVVFGGWGEQPAIYRLQ